VITDREKTQIVLLILEDADRRIALQLRDNLPNLAYGDHWGLFGGHVEMGEQPLAAGIREVREELGCTLDPHKMKPFQTLNQNPERDYFIFCYEVSRELDTAKLAEGQRFGFFTQSQIEQTSIEGKEIVPHHRKALRDYWSGNGSH
jgi:8-oxo-dGTP pyrophosphatase MutT (NUDIX family)